MRLSQGDLADLLDVSRATVSEATSEGYKCSGYPVRAWAEFDGSGRVAGYDVPSRVVERSNPRDGLDGSTDELGFDEELFERKLEEAQQSTGSQPVNKSYASLLPEGEDYSKTVGAGGAAHVVGKAIEEDNTTSHGATMAAGAGVGGVVGMCAASEDDSVSTATGAIVGSLFGAAATYLGMSTDFDEPEQDAVGGKEAKPRALSARSEQPRLSSRQDDSRTHEGQSSGITVTGS